MKFGVREICDVVLRARSRQQVGTKTFYKDEPVCYFDSLKTSTIESAVNTVYAQGGRGNSRLVAWEGEKTVTFTMEDALLSPESFSILAGAGLFDASADKPIYVHTTEQTATFEASATEVSCMLSKLPADPAKVSNAKIFVMISKFGELVSEPYIAAVDEHNPKKIVIKEQKSAEKYRPDLSKFLNAEGKKDEDIVLFVDYYIAKTEGARQIDITPEKFGGNYYLEASTLFRDTNGVDMPAEFIIPNCNIQSNFTFTMGASGDPSTFTFTMDAFPDYTKFDPTKKVLSAIQIITDDLDEDLTAERKSTDADAYDADIVAGANMDEEIRGIGAEFKSKYPDKYEYDVNNYPHSKSTHGLIEVLVGEEKEAIKPTVDKVNEKYNNGLSEDQKIYVTLKSVLDQWVKATTDEAKTFAENVEKKNSK